MAELTVFGYRRLPTLVHTLDARIKLAGMAAISMASLNAGPVALTLTSLLVVVTLWQIGVRPFQLLREFKYFLVLLSCIILTRALTTPGTPAISWSFLSLSRQGAEMGAMICWRLMLMLLISMLITCSTPPDEIRSAIVWFFKPLPHLYRQRIGILIGLLMRFIPLILMQARQIADVQRARGIENRKNPIFRIRIFCMALLRLTFVTAGHLAIAMESRCYGLHRTSHPWRLKTNDWLALAVLILLCGVMVTFG